MVGQLFRWGGKAAKTGSKGSKVTKIGSTGWFARRSLKNTTKANVGGKFKYVTDAGASMDDAFKKVGADAATKAGKGYKVPAGHKVVDDTGELIAKPGASFGSGTKATKAWKSNYRIVKMNKISPSVKASRSSSILSKAKSIPVPGFKNTFRFGFIAVVGYGTYRLISIVGGVSDRAEEVINNFFGIDCEEGDIVCEERGAKNMLLTGVLGIAVVGGLLYMSLKPKGKEDKQEVEIKISKDEAATAA
jgi:hypothetical protein